MPERAREAESGRLWAAWASHPGHRDCGGWQYDPGTGLLTCACGTVIPVAEIVRVPA